MQTLFKIISSLLAVNARHRKGVRMKDAHPAVILHQASNELDALAKSPDDISLLSHLFAVLAYYAVKKGWGLERIQSHAIDGVADGFPGSVDTVTNVLREELVELALGQEAEPSADTSSETSDDSSKAGAFLKCCRCGGDLGVLERDCLFPIAACVKCGKEYDSLASFAGGPPKESHQGEDMVRVVRTVRLSTEDAARYNKIRNQVEQELPDLIARHLARMEQGAGQ